jgi:hypothetical protein
MAFDTPSLLINVPEIPKAKRHDRRFRNGRQGAAISRIHAGTVFQCISASYHISARFANATQFMRPGAAPSLRKTRPAMISPPEASEPPPLQGRTRKRQERQGIVWVLGKSGNNSPDCPFLIEMPSPVTLLVG